MTTNPDKPSRIDALASEIRARILEGELAAGTRLVERELVSRHAVARHTLRAALRALAAEGLVDLVPHRGAQVAAPRRRDVEELFELRTALEVEAARLALARDPEGLRTALESAVTELRRACARPGAPWREIADAHAVLHRSIVEHARAPRIESVHAGLDAELRLVLVALRPAWSAQQLVAHHEALQRALFTRGPEALRDHLADGAEAVLG